MADLKKVFDEAEEKKTSATKKSPRSSTKAARTPAKSARAAVTPFASENSDMPDASEDMRKKELIDLVAAKSGLKRGVAKQALEASLAVLGEVLSEGRSISAPPLGKIKVVRQKETPNGKMAVIRLKFKSADGTGAAAEPEGD